METDPKSAPTVVAPADLDLKVPSSRDVRIDALVGTVVDERYLIERIIGEGGMGIVYRARHRVIDKLLAVKVLRMEMAGDKEMTARFLQEAQTASKIGNGHIVEVADFGVMPDGATYFVMEYLDGESLGDVIESLRVLPMPRLVHIAKQIAQGLGAAHAAGIVHRDLKPDNVMLLTRGEDRDFVKILDFGIAKVGTEASKITRAGSIFGTPHYMSPEQAAGTPVDQRTDIYALGVIMYEMATGTVPFDSESFMGILSQHLYKAPAPMLATTTRTDVPRAFEAIVMKCLSKGADGRYSSMDALVDDLDSLERGLLPIAMLDQREPTPVNYFEPSPPSQPLASVSSPAPDQRSARRIAVAAGLAVAVLVAAFIVFSMRRTQASGAAPESAPGVIAAAPIVYPTPVTSAAAPAREKLVLLSVDPLDARVFENGRDLGTPPVALHLMPGDRRTFVVSRAGYSTKSEVFAADALEGDEVKRVIKLTSLAPVRGGKPAPKASAKPSGAKPLITDSDPDPWKRTAQ